MREKRWPANLLQQRAKDLRQQMTPAETALWTGLRRKQLAGLKFRRQHRLGPYIVGFCCPQAGLVVEVDGSVHDELRERDEARDAALEARGYRVMHVRNEDVLEHLNRVLLTIAETCQETLPDIASKDGDAE